MKTHYKTCRGLLLTTALATTGVIATAPVAAQMVLEEITVTAQKREQGINDVGITVNAFSGDMLDDLGVKSAEDMALVTPGLTITNTAATGVPIYTIRGVGFSDYSTAASSTVGLYFDEVAIPYAVMSRGVLFDMERVEVLKGPQGDLYGRNTTAGQINFISKKPTDEFEAGVAVDYSRFNVLDVETYASGPITSGIQARLSAKVVQSSEGWQQSLTREGDTLGKRDEVAVRGLINFDLSDNAKLLLNMHLIRDKSDNLATTAYDGTDIGLDSTQNLISAGAIPYSLGDNRAADWTPGEYRPRRDNEMKGISARLDWDFEGMSLTSITAYDKFDRSEANDWDGAEIRDSNNINVTDIEVFSQEVRLSSNNDSNLSWIAGVYYSKDDMSEDYNYFMNDSYYSVALGITELDTRYDQTTESIAAFGHVEWQMTDKFKLTVGARYTEEDREWSGCTYDRNGTLAFAANNIITPFLIAPAGLPIPDDVADGACAVYNDIEGSDNYGQYSVFTDDIATNKWMWKATLDYAPTDDLLFYGTISKGFKSGGFNGANANTHSQLVPYGPEDLISYELGMKSTLAEGRLQVNAAFFYYDYQDKQEQDTAVTFVGNISGLTNVPKSKIKGGEVEVRWLATEGLTVDMGAAYLDTEITEWEAVSSTDSVYPTIVTFDASGLELANSPKWQFNSTVTYEWAISSKLMMMVAGDAIYKDSTTGGAQGLAYATEDYFLANARMGISDVDGDWSIKLYGRNIFNKYYYPAAFVGGNGPYVRMAGMPVTYGITASFKF
ncbi:TonB-dependent receptor [Kordiimonas pumila]|nr:TonB-dependent receptor [Kordiimonas pumila]